MTVPVDLDLLVVGGGPIGLATALGAARSGLSVAVAEPRPAPIDKACGEGLMPTAVERLRGLGVELTGHPFHGITYVAGARQVTADFPGGPGLGVRRLVLHETFAKAAADAGIAVLGSAARLGAVRPTHVEAEVGGAVVRARYLAAADGLHSRVRADLGLALPGRGPARYGLRQHFEITPWSEHVEVHWSDDAEVYVTPVAADEVGVAVLTAVRGRPFAEHLARFPEVAARLGRATASSEVRGAGPLEQRTRRRTAGRVLLVGDAAGYVDAITGEGFAVGLASAAALVDAVLDDDPARYERSWRAVTRTSRVLTRCLLRSTQVEPLRRRLVPAAERLPRVFGAVVARLA